MVTRFSCVLTVQTWHGKSMPLDGVTQEILYAALTDWQKQKWIDLYDPEKFTLSLYQGLYRATFTFPPSRFGWDHDVVSFIHNVSVLRNGNPFRLRSVKFDATFRDWLQHAFSRMSVKTQNKHFPYQKIYAERHIRQLIETGHLDKYGN